MINLVVVVLPLSGMVQVSVQALHYLRKQSPCTNINHTHTHAQYKILQCT